MNRIPLSVPHMEGQEAEFVRHAFESNWLSTVGPNLDGFEREMEARLGRPAVALSSGTAAIHLALRVAGVGYGDEVLCPTLTFVASVNPVRYLGATPVFLDSERASWNLDPGLLAEVIAGRAARNRLPKAVVVVHLFGQCAEMAAINEICARYSIPVVEDAAEALGSTYRGNPAGTLGDVSALSFNGNKIITTSGGGMLLAARQDWVEKARFWSMQAREPGLCYQHVDTGYNYRMSNVLAGIGRGQLRVLDLRVRQRRAIAFRYRDSWIDVPGISLMPQADYGLHTNWLSCFLLDEVAFGCSRDRLVDILSAEGIETRPIWKPMHLQPLFAGYECHGGSIAEDLFRRGICFPSSSSLTEAEQLYVVNSVRRAAKRDALKNLQPSESELACAAAGVTPRA